MERGGGLVDWKNVRLGSSPQYVLSDRSSEGSWQWVEGSSIGEEGMQGWQTGKVREGTVQC